MCIVGHIWQGGEDMKCDEEMFAKLYESVFSRPVPLCALHFGTSAGCGGCSQRGSDGSLWKYPETSEA